MGRAWILTPAGKAGTASRAATVVLGLTALAGAGSPGSGTSPVQAPRCANGEGAAIAELACELVRSLGPLGSGLGVSVAPPKADRTIAHGADLSSRMATAVLHALGPAARALPSSGGKPGQGRPGSGASPLVAIAIEITGGEIRAAADTHPSARGFWDRVRGLREEPGAHASATRRLDGEVSSFLPRVPLVAAHVDKVSGSVPDVVALACGDVDGDSALEIALIGRRKIQLGRAREGRFASHAEAPWTAFAPVAHAPLREPIARAEIATGRSLTIGSTDRESAVVLTGTLALVGRLEASVPWGAAGCLVRSGTALGLPGPCERGSKVALDAGDVQTDAVASGLVVNPAGAVHALVAWRAPESGTVTLRDDAGRTTAMAGTGAALAVADLDRDGVPELLSSENTLNAAEDALVVRSWTDDGKIRDRFRVTVPDGIRAISVCPPSDSQMASIIVATGSSVLWMIR